MSDRESTRQFAIRNVLTNHCGQVLTPNILDSIVRELQEEIEKGPCSWAFIREET